MIWAVVPVSSTIINQLFRIKSQEVNYKLHVKQNYHYILLLTSLTSNTMKLLNIAMKATPMPQLCSYG